MGASNPVVHDEPTQSIYPWLCRGGSDDNFGGHLGLNDVAGERVQAAGRWAPATTAKDRGTPERLGRVSDRQSSPVLGMHKTYPEQHQRMGQAKPKGNRCHGELVRPHRETHDRHACTLGLRQGPCTAATSSDGGSDNQC
jgi:hypothetical protein